jgi:hypothetical protein
MRRSSLIPNETYPPLVIDPDRMLSQPVSLQCLQAVSGWNPKIANDAGLIQNTKLPQSHILNGCRQFSAASAGPDQFSLGISETP